MVGVCSAFGHHLTSTVDHCHWNWAEKKKNEDKAVNFKTRFLRRIFSLMCIMLKQGEYLVTIQACLIRPTWPGRSHHKLTERRHFLLTWTAHDHPANYIKWTLSRREFYTCPRSSLSAWITMVRPTMEFSPERLKNESVMSTLAVPPEASTLPKSPVCLEPLGRWVLHAHSHRG